MPETPLNGNLKWVIALVSLVIGLAGIVFGAGVIRGDVADNTEDIAELKVDLNKRMDQFDAKLDKLIDFQLSRGTN